MSKQLPEFSKPGSARLCLPVKGVVNTTAVSSVEAEPIGLKASCLGPFLVSVHVKDSVVEPWGTQERSVRS